MPERIAVILPIHRWTPLADDAIASVLEQRGAEPELLLIVNGPDPDTHAEAKTWAERDRRVRVIRREQEGLAGALNKGLRAAGTDLVARMDADDLSHPDRLRLQAEHLRAHPDHIACGCGAAFVDPASVRTTVNIPPATPAEARWRLLLGNAFVHGSMMLRRSAVLEAGGYDESIGRGQDYELWLRLAGRGLSGIPDVLYTYRTPPAEIDASQAALTSELLLRAWARLPEGDPDRVAPMMARLLAGDVGARGDLEALLEREGPTRPALQAWMWSCRQHPIARTDTDVRTRRVRAAGEMLRSADPGDLWLWGAGDMARFIIAEGDLGVPIAGLADDHRAGATLSDLPIVRPEEIPASATVLIASDLYEDAIWERSAPLRARGVRVLRMPAA